ncbi:MAG: TIM-barrel domain-containing protein, partial [Bacteroidota bacterium]
DPGIKIDPEYRIYQQGIARGYFCRRADGPLMKGNVWPGACHFPDFTHPKVRNWWAGLVEEFMAMGIHGIWNDMNEPAILEVGTFPMDTRHDYDGQPCSHRKAHNVYGMQMARASYHGMKEAIYPRRPFALTRSGYAGVQRYAATWTGDNVSSWEHLWMASLQCQRLSISGLSFCGSDVGGFIGNCHGELLTRWTQLGVFHPLFRNHTSQDHSVQEPWVFDEVYTDAIRKAIELRYQLLPYFYTVFWRHVEYGTPMVLPLVFMDQRDSQTYNRMDEFGFGSNLLVCPIMGQGEEGRRMYLPEGNWYNYWTGERHGGRSEFWVAAPLDQFPLFVRAGSTIPHYPVMNYVGEKEIEALDLHVYFEKGLNSSQLYEDAGDYYEYEQGNYMLRTFSLEGDATESRIIQRNKGRYNSEYPEFRFILKGWPSEIQSIQVDGKKVRFKAPDAEEVISFYQVTVDKNFEEIKISC